MLSSRTAVACTLLASACNAGPPRIATPGRGAAASPAVDMISCFDLPRDDPRSHDLSGLAWDPSARRLFAISDHEKTLTVLQPRPGFLGFDLQPSIALDIDIDVEGWDGEALAIAGDRFLLVANETWPAVFSVDRAGHDATPLDLPWSRGMRDNLGLEGIGYASSAAGRFVFVVNEQAVESDGPTSTTASGTVVRILRHPLDGGADLEVAYLTEPVFAEGTPADSGVSDLAPLSPERLLVMERSYVQGKGNAILIYEVDLRGAPNIAALADARAAVPLRKRLIVDLARVSDERCSMPPAPQRRRSLDNFEGLALGPTLDDGRRLVFLVSDDNHRRTQVPRVITLALAPGVL